MAGAVSCSTSSIGRAGRPTDGRHGALQHGAKRVHQSGTVDMERHARDHAFEASSVLLAPTDRHDWAIQAAPIDGLGGAGVHHDRRGVAGLSNGRDHGDRISRSGREAS